MADDGQTTETTIAIEQATANVRFNNLGLVRRVLHTVANPTLAYLLLIGGALALLFEVFQPGFGVAGVSGIVLIGLALYGLAVLPVNWLAFGLIVLGLLLLAIDLAIAGLGALSAGGTVSLAVGSFLLFSSAPALRLSLWVIAPVVLFNVLFFVIIMTTVLRAQSSQAMLGAEGMAGREGVVRSMLNPEGHIFVNGALWRARAPEHQGKVKTGTKVRVLGVNDRLTLDVEVLDSENESDAADQTTVG
jgi:membrane-bound serine protease (ClpP class)